MLVRKEDDIVYINITQLEIRDYDTIFLNDLIK